MGKVVLIGLAVVAVVIVGGIGFLMTWNIPAPSQHVERVLPDARFPH
jgi:hypothetical protein